MKSRTLSCNATVFCKDLTRFAPGWIAWCVMYLVGIYLCYELDADLTTRAGLFSNFLALFSLANCVYGIGCAVTLFGYLCDKQECAAVHAFPIRRETYFVLHICAGLTMSVVPGAVFCAAVAGLNSGSPLLLFLGMQAQFLFYFALGVFCVMLVGRRLAAVAIYALVQAMPAIVKLMLDMLYLPLLPGVHLNSHQFYRFSPVYAMMAKSQEQRLWRFGRDWDQYMAVLGLFAAIGLVLLVAALALYRRRKLEFAGDFLAVKWLQPAFISMMCVTFGFAAAVLALLADSTDAASLGRYIVVCAGIAVGYFGALMLMRRTAKVFTLRSLAGLAVVLAVSAGSLWATGADVLGRVTYVPKAEQVERVELSHNEYSEYCFTARDSGTISQLTQLHADILANEDFSNYYTAYQSAFLTYYLSDGTQLQRVYYVSKPQQMQRLNYFFSQPENMLGVQTLEQWLEQAVRVSVRCQNDLWILDRESAEALCAIVFEEMTEGKMVLSGPDSWNDGYSGNISLELQTEAGNGYSFDYVSIPVTAVKSRAWIDAYTAEHLCSESWGD